MAESFVQDTTQACSLSRAFCGSCFNLFSHVKLSSFTMEKGHQDGIKEVMDRFYNQSKPFLLRTGNLVYNNLNMDNIWKHSRPISPEEVTKTAAFTTLPIRIHKLNDVADAASQRLLKDWDHHMQERQSQKSRTSTSSLGNMCAFGFPEALPERLAVLTYLTDLGLMHDGELWELY
jgi:hypothetical protein